MTYRQLVEEIKQYFPDMNMAEALLRIDRAQREFCRKSRCIIGYEDLQAVEFSNGEVLLDESIVSVRGAYFITAAGARIDMEDTYTFLIKDRHVVLLDSAGQRTDTFPSTAAYFRLQCVLQPTTGANLDDSPLVDEEFHNAFVYKVVAEKELQKGDMVKAGMMLKLFNERVSDAKRYANIEADEAPSLPYSIWNDSEYGVSLDDGRDV